MRITIRIHYYYYYYYYLICGNSAFTYPDAIQESLQLPRTFNVNVLLAYTSIQAPCELVAWIDRYNVLNFEIMKSHQKLRSEGTIVNVFCSQEESSEELEYHIVKLDTITDHVGQFLYNFALSSHLKKVYLSINSSKRKK